MQNQENEIKLMDQKTIYELHLTQNNHFDIVDKKIKQAIADISEVKNQIPTKNPLRDKLQKVLQDLRSTDKDMQEGKRKTEELVKITISTTARINSTDEDFRILDILSLVSTENTNKAMSTLGIAENQRLFDSAFDNPIEDPVK